MSLIIEFLKYIFVIFIMFKGFEYFILLFALIYKPNAADILFGAFSMGFYILLIFWPFYFICRKFIYKPKDGSEAPYVISFFINTFLFSQIWMLAAFILDGICTSVLSPQYSKLPATCERASNITSRIIFVIGYYFLLRFEVFAQKPRIMPFFKRILKL